MFQEKSDNTYTAPVKQPEKSSKEKTLDTVHKNNQGQVDVTKALTDPEIVLISDNNENAWESSFGYPDSIADYQPGKYQDHVVVAEPPKKEEKKGHITSYVGDCITNEAKGRIANLGKDIDFVQKHLNRLEILSDESYTKEKPTTDKEISKNKIPLTIVAIDYFQREVLSCKVDGEIWPGKDNIKDLVAITVDQKNAKHLEYLKQKKEREKREVAEKARADEEAKVKAKEQMLKKAEKINIEIAKVVQAPNNKEMEALWDEQVSAENMANYLKYHIIYNEDYGRAVYRHTNTYKTDDLTRALMKILSEQELDMISYKVKNRMYYSLSMGWTSDEEIAFMKQLRKSMGESGEKENEEKEDVKVSKKVKDEAAEDLQTVRGIVRYKLKGPVGKKDSVADDKKNYPADVKQTAYQLKEKGYTVSDDSLKKGVCDQIFIDALGEFQVDNDIVKEDKTPYYYMNANGGCYKKLFEPKNFTSGITDIHSGRKIINAQLSTKRVLTSGVGDSENSLEKEAKNEVEDVKYVASRLKVKGIDVPKVSIEEGICNAELIAAIKEYEKILEHENQYGIITKNGGDIKTLHASDKFIDNLKYENKDHSGGTKKDEYFDKLDSLQKKLNIKESSDNGKLISIARKAARNKEYFTAFTEDTSAKLLLKAEHIEDNGYSLSSILVDRMQRFHKFMVAAGMYSGDMDVNSGIRSDKTAHIWCGQWIIAGGGAGSTKGSTYVNATKNIILEMYSEQKLNSSEYITDENDTKWAKKDHFKEENGTLTMDWISIKEFVATIEGGRTSYTTPASAGYEKGDERRKPVPSGSPSVTNHKTGEAIDINRHNFLNEYDSIVDVIALQFGLLRDGGPTEWWHFELTDLEMSQDEIQIDKDQSYPELITDN